MFKLLLLSTTQKNYRLEILIWNEHNDHIYSGLSNSKLSVNWNVWILWAGKTYIASKKLICTHSTLSFIYSCVKKNRFSTNWTDGHSERWQITFYCNLYLLYFICRWLIIQLCCSKHSALFGFVFVLSSSHKDLVTSRCRRWPEVVQRQVPETLQAGYLCRMIDFKYLSMFSLY